MNLWSCYYTFQPAGPTAAVRELLTSTGTEPIKLVFLRTAELGAQFAVVTQLHRQLGLKARCHNADELHWYVETIRHAAADDFDVNAEDSVTAQHEAGESEDVSHRGEQRVPLHELKDRKEFLLGRDIDGNSGEPFTRQADKPVAVVVAAPEGPDGGMIIKSRPLLALHRRSEPAVITWR
ncbi:hypothetical protein O7622_18335 [Micromonospora sp. WMMD1076]|uniref:hypothetical protein n=1 Tax=Micromonospora sp. WMMD1076 TaxID=3016103 RepID=UPI00249A412D|nr:hypothetical protein [Micromonospora sp. WMMD1076]WFF05020.1 hypothetical protein O7622_18335 [Micromonospora sp. WMMD1076]